MTKPLTLENNVVAVDVETQGLADDAKLLGLSWADLFDSGAEQWTGKASQVEYWQSVLDDKWVVFHNAKFDIGVLARNGLTVRRYYDTQIMAYVVDPTHESYNLENCALREGVAEKMSYAPEDWKTAEWDDEMAAYAEQDAVTTNELYYKYRDQLLDDSRALEHFLTIEMPFVEVIREMEFVGFNLDMPALEQLHKSLVEKTELLLSDMLSIAGYLPDGAATEYKTRVPLGVAGGGMTGVNVLAARPYCDIADRDKGRMYKGEWRLAKKFEKVDRDLIYDHCKVTPFNPNSGAHIAYSLGALYGWSPQEFTPTGQPKTDTEQLEYVQDDMPLAKILVEYAEANKVLTSFIAPFVEMQTNGILKGNFNQTVTKTGRLSSSNPNLQNIPTRSELGQEVRKLIVAPPGYKIVGIDLSNIEGRVLASYLGLKMKDFGMSETFNAGVDFHQANADRWGVSRTDAKTLLYATLYGAGPAKIGNGDKARGKALLKTLEQNAPSMFKLKEKAWKGAEKGKGVIHTLFGRRLVYGDIIPSQAVRHAKQLKREKPDKYTEDESRLAYGLTARAQRQVFNALLQGTAADIMKLLTIQAMPLIRRARGFLAAQVHDEILVYVPEHFAPWLQQELTKLFTRDDLLPHVMVTGDAAIGDNWASVH